MSRPFSYDDENFTVIGNVLFCHILVEKTLYVDRYIIEIPPEIYKRLLYKSCVFTCLGTIDDEIVTQFVNVGVSVNPNSRKYYLYTGSVVSDVGNYLIGYYILKDI